MSKSVIEVVERVRLVDNINVGAWRYFDGIMLRILRYKSKHIQYALITIIIYTQNNPQVRYEVEFLMTISF